MFFNRLSSCARLLDWLSEKYQVLFCVSAGNILSKINLGKNDTELKNLDNNELIGLTLQKINDDIRNRRLFAPSEAINALTIGSLHNDGADTYNLGNLVDILPTTSIASPISAHGHGFRNSIKPEIYYSGGRQLFQWIGNNEYQTIQSILSPGHRVVTSDNSGSLNKTIYTRGTSNAAALISRRAVQIYDSIVELMQEYEGSNQIQDDNIAVLIKALLIHGAEWGDSRPLLETALKNDENSRNFKKVLSRYCGYGIPNINKVIECTERRATTIGYGKINVDQRHEYIIPLPPSLSSSNDQRRLVITLAWFSPINPDHRKYRRANLSFISPNEDIGTKRFEADGRQVRNGTIQHEIHQGDKMVVYQDGDNIKIPVICEADAGNLDDEVNYGLVVTLEVPEEVDIQIYEEIKERIDIEITVGDSG